ncbi:GNAT family N-acetyltransferase [Peribacillus sp. JNUCC 23]|uniref:GNAT family N-acetyltransferase n=1 Tax=Peribacillus sp. NPDC096379 TaxID=3364393 RepID=UPI003800AEFF
MQIEAFLKTIPNFETDRLILRKIELNDLEDIFEFSSDPEVAHHMTWEVNKSKEETLNNFVNVVIGNYEKGQTGDLAIIHKESSKVIGTCSFIEWSNEHSNAEIGYVLNRNYWGLGIATEAINELIRFGFETIQLNRIQGRCDIDNVGSEKVMLKVGMCYEGTLRKNEFIKGEFKDTKIFSILKEEFLLN